MEVFKRLGLQEVANIIKTLGVSTEISDMHGYKKIGDEIFVYEKKGNTLTITCESGKNLSVAVDCSVKERVDKNGNSYELPVHEVYFEYRLANGELLYFDKELHLSGYYEGFEDVNRHNLLTEAKTGYVNAEGKTVASFSTELTNIKLNNSEITYIFALDGKDEPIASMVGDSMSTIDDCATLTTEAKIAQYVRGNLKLGISKDAINPDAIDQIGNLFRKDVFAYKAANKGAR